MKKTSRPTNKKIRKTLSKKAPQKANAKKNGKEKDKERTTLVHSAITDIGKLLAKEDTNVALVRFDIGEQVTRLMKAEGAHGKGLVAEVAKELGRDADTLYDYARVAARWTRTGFQKLAARKNAAGATLSFSHFVELARKDGKNGTGLTQEQWMPLLEQALKEKLSVQALRELVRRALGGEESSRASAMTTVHMLAKVTGGIFEKASALGELVDELEKKGVAASEVDQLTLTIEQVEKTHTACAALLTRLHLVKSSTEAPLVAAE